MPHAATEGTPDPLVVWSVPVAEDGFLPEPDALIGEPERRRTGGRRVPDDQLEVVPRPADQFRPELFVLVADHGELFGGPRGVIPLAVRPVREHLPRDR